MLHTAVKRIHAGKALSGKELAQMIQGITACEVVEGGPYYLPGTKKTDLGFNLAIAEFLAACDVTLPALDAFIDRALTNSRCTSEACTSDVLNELAAAYRTRHASSAHTVSARGRSSASFTPEEKHMMACIRAVFTTRTKGLPAHLVNAMRRVVDRTMSANGDKQMSLMALYMRDALGKRGARFDDTCIAELGLANVFFWTAFIIYDDFWDEDEAAEAQLLPTANLFARHYTDVFSSLLPEKTGFRTFFHTHMDALDAANTWETVYCRMSRDGRVLTLPDALPQYRDFSIKFYPAAGHIMGPVALLVRLGYAIESPEVTALVRYFKHYLIAMQLNDDLHDWKEDIERGHVSTVVAALLTEWRRKNPRATRVHLDNDMSELEHILWFSVLEPICESILAHSAKSRRALRSLTLIENPEPLERFITRNERSAREALAEQRQSVEFVRAF